MDKKPQIRKNFAIGIIFLFVGTCIIPMTAQTIKKPDVPIRKTISDFGERYNKADIPDQEDQTQTNYTGNAQLVHDRFYAAQEFKPTLEVLTRVFLFVTKDGNPPNDLTVGVSFSLMETSITQISIPKDLIPEWPEINWIEVNFPDVRVKPQESYYIIMKTIGGDSNNCYEFGEGSGNPYPIGQAYWSESNGTSWGMIYDIDFCFRTYGYNSSTFYVSYGVAYVYGTIDSVFHFNSSGYYSIYTQNVSKVTVIGFGNYIPEKHLHFYMKSFTNVSEFGGVTLRKMQVSDEYRHFIIIPHLHYPVGFSTY